MAYYAPTMLPATSRQHRLLISNFHRLLISNETHTLQETLHTQLHYVMQRENVTESSSAKIHLYLIQ